MSRSTKFDLHLSAYSLSPDTIRKVEALGFKRDMFANNRRCDTTAYHGTFRGERSLPDDGLWKQLEDIFRSDTSFVGGLEEEVFTPAEVIRFNGDSSITPRPAADLQSQVPAPGSYKACDIHINVDLEASSDQGIAYLESFGLASFDKPQENGTHRVYSATCASIESGRKLFRELTDILPTIPGLVGKMKFEAVTRFLRLPNTAPALPLTSDNQLEAWLREMKL